MFWALVLLCCAVSHSLLISRHPPTVTRSDTINSSTEFDVLFESSPVPLGLQLSESLAILKVAREDGMEPLHPTAVLREGDVLIAVCGQDVQEAPLQGVLALLQTWPDRRLLRFRRGSSNVRPDAASDFTITLHAHEFVGLEVDSDMFIVGMGTRGRDAPNQALNSLLALSVGDRILAVDGECIITLDQHQSSSLPCRPSVVPGLDKLKATFRESTAERVVCVNQPHSRYCATEQVPVVRASTTLLIRPGPRQPSSSDVKAEGARLTQADSGPALLTSSQHEQCGPAGVDAITGRCLRPAARHHERHSSYASTCTDGVCSFVAAAVVLSLRDLTAPANDADGHSTNATLQLPVTAALFGGHFLCHARPVVLADPVDGCVAHSNPAAVSVCIQSCVCVHPRAGLFSNVS